MNNLSIIEKTGTDAVKRLRKRKLESGKPFMINSKDLPVKQSYLEYPDKTINVVSIASDSRSFITVRKLSSGEAVALRRRFKLN
jgi:hydrogenase maturation factor HypF (carbamoyltransferase family)